MTKREIRKKNEMRRQRRKMLKFSDSVFAVGVVGGGLGIGSTYLLTGGPQPKDPQKMK